MRYSAALLGPGSEVLGFDTPLSTDHHWGPRLQIFLSEEDFAAYVTRVNDVLSQKLPYRFRGYSTNFGPPDEIGVRLLKDTESGLVGHRVEVTTIRSFLETYLGVNSYDEMQILDWLTVPEQRLLSVAAGRVYHDGLGDLNRVRQKYAYYPRDVWLYMLAAQWTRISDEEAFVGRTGNVGDELGSQIVAARLVRALMKLCFLMERQYAPYSKWFGTAFARLPCAPRLAPIFQNALRAQSWRVRERHLSRAYSIIAEMHNALGITHPLPTKVSPFYNRPYQVIHSERFAEEIRKRIIDQEVRKIEIPIGSIDQFIDSTNVMDKPKLYRKLRAMFEQ